ncbi:MAG: T9SS type A sorting domain-containing protein [Vicingaceae bacterium]
MKKIFTLSAVVLFGASIIAQTLPGVDPADYGVAKPTNKKFYIKDGKVTESIQKQTNQKNANDVTQYLDYFDVEIDGYGFGNATQVPRFYWTMHDSNFTHIGTSFTHIFDLTTFDFFGFDSIGKIENVDYLIIDSVLFNFGHSNNSGIANTLALSLRTLPLGGGPSQTGSLIWSDTTTSTDFTPTLAINFLPLFSAPVAETLSYQNRGVYFEIYFDGEMGQDTGAFLANYWDSGINCPPLNGPGGVESFTLRENDLQDGRTAWQDPTQSIIWGNPADQYYSNFNVFFDCNANSSYDRGTNEAYFVQNVAMGIYFTYGGEFLGVEERNAGLSEISQNYPNPFSATTDINYTLENQSRVTVNVFDITGKTVMNINEGVKNAGPHKLTIDGSNLNNGVYYYNFVTDSGQVTKKMVVQR